MVMGEGMMTVMVMAVEVVAVMATIKVTGVAMAAAEAAMVVDMEVVAVDMAVEGVMEVSMNCAHYL